MNEKMRNYTAVFSNKSGVVKEQYTAGGPKEAIQYARKFSAWPNVVIFDDTYTIIPSYGEMIYMNGEIVKRSCDGDYLLPSLCVYDSVRTTLNYACAGIYHKVSSITGKPSMVKFITDIGLQLQKLSSLCQEEAKRQDEPCRWI